MDVGVTLVNLLMVGKKEDECSVFIKSCFTPSSLEISKLKSPSSIQSIFFAYSVYVIDLPVYGKKCQEQKSGKYTDNKYFVIIVNLNK